MDLECTQPSGGYLPWIYSLHYDLVDTYHGSGVYTTIRWILTRDLESVQPFGGYLTRDLEYTQLST
jgi:hypothetical protein